MVIKRNELLIELTAKVKSITTIAIKQDNISQIKINQHKQPQTIINK